jgi:hypothetical protein
MATMNGRGVLNFLLGLLVLGVLVAIGGGIYQAGLTQGIIDAGRFPAGTAVPVAGYGWGHGFGFLGLLFPILFLLLIFGLIRAAFSRGRGWGPGWHHGDGSGWAPGGGPSTGGPESWRQERDRRISELHRQLHEADGDAGTSGSPPRQS